jgi:hypothetical protein
MAENEKLQPIDVSTMTLDDVDRVSNDVLREALQSVIRRENSELMHQSHRSHGSKI